MKPEDLITVFEIARKNKIIDSHSALFQLLSERNIINDIYQLHYLYEDMNKHYRSKAVKDKIKKFDDIGVWNRRDGIASYWMMHIHRKYHIEYRGYRKYTDILSGETGNQLFISCLILSYLLQIGYFFKDGRWTTNAQRCDLSDKFIDVCRPCVKSIAVS